MDDARGVGQPTEKCVLTNVRVLVLQDYLRCGGTEHQTIFCCEFLHKAGHDVLLLTLRPGGALSKKVHLAGVPHRSLQKFDFHLDFAAPGLSRQIRLWNPDVLICMGKTANCYGGYIQERFPTVTVIGTVRTGNPLSPMELWSLKRVRGILTNTCWWRKALAREGIAAGNIGVVRNALLVSGDPNGKARVRQALRHRMGAGPGTAVFVNVASFRPGKRQDLLIRYFSGLEPTWDYQLWLVGDGKKMQKCRRLTRHLDKGGHVKLLGYVQDPWPYYAGADVAVSTSSKEALPNFLVEAQAAGLPAVATKFRGADETIVDGETGVLVHEKDDALFREHIRRFCVDEQTRKRMGGRAMECANARHSPQRIGREILDFLLAVHHGSQSPVTSFQLP